MKEEVIRQLNAVGPLPPELRDHLTRILTDREIPKGTEVLAAGAVCREIFWVDVGMVLGLKHQKDQEVTTWIMREGNFVLSPASFFGQTPSLERIIAVERCLVCGITREQLQDTYRRYPIFNLHGRIITEAYYLRSLDREEFLKRYTAKEKYVMLMKQDPELILRCPAKYLASYLNVNVTTLSTIRSEVMHEHATPSSGRHS